MAWPADDLTTTHLDAGSDSPAQARSELLAAITRLKQVIDARGIANGVASLDNGAQVPAAQIPKLPIADGIFSDIVAGGGKTWTVPAGVTRIRVEIWGGGGGGAFSPTDDHGGGGGAGGGAVKLYTVEPGDVVNYSIGAGGTGQSGSPTTEIDGGDGEDSSATVGGVSIIGRGGGGGEAVSGFGGAGGDGVGGDVNMSGGTAASGNGSRGGVGGSNARCGAVVDGSPAGYAGGTGSGAPAGAPGGIIIEW